MSVIQVGDKLVGNSFHELLQNNYIFAVVIKTTAKGFKVDIYDKKLEVLINHPTQYSCTVQPDWFKVSLRDVPVRYYNNKKIQGWGMRYYDSIYLLEKYDDTVTYEETSYL